MERWSVNEDVSIGQLKVSSVRMATVKDFDYISIREVCFDNVDVSVRAWLRRSRGQTGRPGLIPCPANGHKSPGLRFRATQSPGRLKLCQHCNG